MQMPCVVVLAAALFGHFEGVGVYLRIEKNLIGHAWLNFGLFDFSIMVLIKNESVIFLAMLCIYEKRQNLIMVVNGNFNSGP